ncbi:hypothetical protein LR48_Vigan07g107500 [Vigna angularis]|uniref:UDP-glycosyltransferases domain-containing protein n=2 Tax=Phaseolus angularis TaxID=3914 RepID=A0A0L9UXB1_PHAAN|nr:hypothetical protein LR48_Vigan07g107500 [Vigna angularis]
MHNSGSGGRSGGVCHVVAMPFPGRGHINPMMNLCKILASRRPNEILITFVVTEEWLGFIGADPKPESIRLAAIPNVIPNERHKAANFPAFYEAVMTNMEEPFDRLLDQLEPPPTVIIGCVELRWPIALANRRNIPVAAFWTMSAAFYSMLHHLDVFAQQRHLNVDKDKLELGENPSSVNNDHNHDYIQWLDSQPPESVLYISLGSFLSVSGAQMNQIVEALNSSNVCYLWVARADASWLKDKCGGKGMVVPWCDQLKVLSHSSVGGFWSHCGWNSTLEALFTGVPMLTFPLFLDQVPNSSQIVDEWRNGCKVEAEKLDTEEVLAKEKIEKLVKRFMDLESQEGKQIRDRAREMKAVCHRAISTVGSSHANLDAFIRYIS